jgi:hypothetical protein
MKLITSVCDMFSSNWDIFVRLRHNVIRTGIKMISHSYSCISFEDICTKLHLDSKEDAEYIVAKVNFKILSSVNFWRY